MLQEGGRFSLPKFFVPPGTVQGGFLTLLCYLALYFKKKLDALC